MDISQEFDRICDGYTDKISRWVPFYGRMLGFLVGNLPADITSPENILDLGCGNGNVSALATECFPMANINLVDASSEMIEACKQRFVKQEKFNYDHTYFQELVFNQNTFDLILAGFSLHHLRANEKQSIFTQAYSWLKPGGYLAMADLFVEKTEEPYHSEVVKDWKSRSMDLGTTEEEWDWIMEHYDQYDHPNGFEQQLNWLENAGFKEPKINWRKGAWGIVLAKK